MSEKNNNISNSEVINDGFAIPKRNILYIIGGLCVMVLGYVFMIGGGSVDPNTFNTEMFSFARTVLAPVLIILGIILEIIAIMFLAKTNK